MQVFPPYQGTIIDAFAEVGNNVDKGQPLYTIKSPDLIQAESTLIGAAATFDLTGKELARAKGLSGTNGVSVRELEQATSDQQTAEGALKAARDAVLVFGKTDSEIDQMIASRKIDPALIVRSPISGKITAQQRAAGIFCAAGEAGRRLIPWRTFRENGCWRALSRRTSAGFGWDSQSKPRCRHIRTACLKARSRKSTRPPIRHPSRDDPFRTRRSA